MSESDVQPTAEELKGVKRSAEDDAELIKKLKSSNGAAAVHEEDSNGAEEQDEDEEDLDEEDLGEEEEGEGEEDFDDEDGEDGEEEEAGEEEDEDA